MVWSWYMCAQQWRRARTTWNVDPNFISMFDLMLESWYTNLSCWQISRKSHQTPLFAVSAQRLQLDLHCIRGYAGCTMRLFGQRVQLVAATACLVWVHLQTVVLLSTPLPQVPESLGHCVGEEREVKISRMTTPNDLKVEVRWLSVVWRAATDNNLQQRACTALMTAHWWMFVFWILCCLRKVSAQTNNSASNFLTEGPWCSLALLILLSGNVRTVKNGQKVLCDTLTVLWLVPAQTRIQVFNQYPNNPRIQFHCCACWEAWQTCCRHSTELGNLDLLPDLIGLIWFDTHK